MLEDHTFLPATHTFIHEWNEPSCLYSVSIHQMASPGQGNSHPITAYYSVDERLSWLSWMTLYRTVYPHTQSPISCRSSVGQGKFFGHRSTFYHCAIQPSLMPCSVVNCLLPLHLKCCSFFVLNIS